MGYFLTAQGAYYEGDQQGDDAEVPRRPSPLHVWTGDGWDEDPLAYRARREAEYRERVPGGDQLDAIRKFLATLNPPPDSDLGRILAEVAAIKDENPKP